MLIALVVPAILLEGMLRPEMGWRWLSVGLTMAFVPTLLWRRTHPMPVVVLVFGSLTAVELARVIADVPPADIVSGAYVLLLAYALFRWGSGRDAAIGLVIMLTLAVLATIAGDGTVGEAIGGFAVFVATVALGASVRYRSTGRRRTIEQVRLVEREQLARDLHDTVAHHVSAIAISAQAGLATAAARPDAAVEALRVIEAEASRTLAEMRSMVGTLRRDEPASLAPLPGLAELDTLSRSGTGRPAVFVEVHGDLDRVPPPVAHAVYRIAQEAVTNARRHATAAGRIDVCVRIADDHLQLDVVDDGERARDTAEPPGYGVLGMIERAEILGGRCTAGPEPERGWRVHADVPFDGATG